MQFLAPLMLLGAIAVAVPIVIHLFGRQRAKVVRFGAMDFLLGTQQKTARRLRMKELALLALRALACLALPLALAKPMASCDAKGALIERGPQAVALIIDNSFATGWRAGDETLFTRARARAQQILEGVGHEAEVAILFTAEDSESPAELSRDHLKLSAQLKAARVSARPADTAGALRRAGALLAGSPHQARRVYLVSALAQTGFASGGEPAWPPASGIELNVIDVTGGDKLANVAVTAVRAEKEPDLGARGVRVTATVANYGPSAVSKLGITLRVAGKPVARGLLDIGAGESASKRFSVPLPGDTRAAEASVEIDSDALVADDRRYVRLELRSEARVLVVDGDPRTVRHDDETFYLETALRPGDRADSAISVTAATPDDLPGVRVADYDAIFLCNVPALPPEIVGVLLEWVKRGGGLFISVGDKVDAELYRTRMGQLLPQELSTPRTPAAAGVSARERDEAAERLAAKLEAGHPIFSVFGGQGIAALRAARFHRIFLLGPTTRGDRRVLARFASGAPALVEGVLGKGRVLLYTSTIDRDWTDLPIHQAFLPLMQQIVRYLAREPAREPASESLVGKTRDVPVGPEDTRLEIMSPSSVRTAFDVDRLKGRATVSFAQTVEPGFYHVAAAIGGEPPRSRPTADFVVNLDARGSDLRPVAPELLPSTDKAVEASPERRKKRVELWHGLAAGLLLLLFVEGVLARR